MACPYLNPNDDFVYDEETKSVVTNPKKSDTRPTIQAHSEPLSTKKPVRNTQQTTSTKRGQCNENKIYTDCYYHDYLNLNKILTANHPRSAEFLDEPSHDEHLFITIHQAYELWFKQILHELDSCISVLGPDILNDREHLKIVSRLERINKILRLLVDQFSVLDTMTPMNFLDFRKYLKPASGFQSVQFRLLENRLGLQSQQRMRYNKKEYTKVLSAEHENLIKRKEKGKASLFDVLQRWLERFPYLECDGWSFWTEYKAAVNEYILEEKQLYLSNLKLQHSDTEMAKVRQEIEQAYNAHIATFHCIFDENIYAQLRNEGKVRLSHKALQAALMIMLYREEPVLQMPFRVLEQSMDLDNLLTQWRNAHALMVHRMLGSKMGTGGSSGFHYLRTAAIHHKVFADFFNLSTYMIPSSNLPQLPNSLRFLMDFPSSNCHAQRANSMHQLQAIHPFTKDPVLPFATLNRTESFSPVLLMKNDPSNESPTNESVSSSGVVDEETVNVD